MSNPGISFAPVTLLATYKEAPALGQWEKMMSLASSLGVGRVKMEQDPVVFTAHFMSSACLWSVEKFSQRVSLIRKIRIRENKGKVKGDQVIMYSLSIVNQSML